MAPSKPAAVQPSTSKRPPKRRPSTSLTHVRGALKEQRDAHIARLAAIDGTAYLANQLAGDEQLVVAQLAGTRRLIAETEEALRRLDEGTYGACQRCGDPIPAARLEIVPHARYCVTCQEHSESRAM